MSKKTGWVLWATIGCILIIVVSMRLANMWPQEYIGIETIIFWPVVIIEFILGIKVSRM